MTTEIRLWKVQPDRQLSSLQPSKLDLEERLEEWLAQDPSLLSNELLIIGRQVETRFGGVIDLICLDRKGDTVIIELKRDKTSRDIVAQVLDYASWVNELSNEDISGIANKYLSSRDGHQLEESFREKFDSELPEVLNESHSILVVGSDIDNATERIIKYLSDTYGVNINAVTFQYFRDDSGGEYVGRAFLIQPSQVEYKTQTIRSSKRKPNLTLEELQALAVERGVGHQYNRLVGVLEKYFTRTTTRSSLAFYGAFDDSRKAIFSLLPTESSPEEGLRYQVYRDRFTNYFQTTADKLLDMLPKDPEDWKYWPSAPQDYHGYTGTFQTDDDVDKFIDMLKGLKN